MADQQLEDNKIRVRKYLRKHYIQMKYIAICRYCSLQIPCKSYYIKLFIHLKNEHSKVLTEQQKRDQNVHWVWDYFTPITQKRAQCNICNGTLSSVDIVNLTRHLDTHRHLCTIFNPNPDIDMGKASSSASGGTTVKDVEHQEASIPIASNLTDNTDRSGVPHKSATKTSESTEHVTNSPFENIENIENIKKELPAELELCDKEEVPSREELPVREELPAREEFLEMKELQLLPDQSSDNIRNHFYSPDRECEITYDLLKKE